MKGWGVLLIAVVLAAVPASAGATSGPGSEGSRAHATIRFPSSNGYQIEVEASGRRRESLVIVSAKNDSSLVTYGLFGSLGRDGSLDVHLPHVGRIAVDFVPIKTTRRRSQAGCSGRNRVVEYGYFRGTIELHGERDFTAVNRSRAPGQLSRSFGRPCGKGTAGRGRSTANARKMRVGAVLVAGPRHGSLSLLAGRGKFPLGSAGTFVLASHNRFREGMTITNSASYKGGLGVFDAPEPGEPKIAELAPPAPFEGSARFELTSPKSSTWRGDLAVELPGVGRVRLAGPSFESTFCLSTRCTNTASGVVAFLAEAFAGLFD